MCAMWGGLLTVCNSSRACGHSVPSSDHPPLPLQLTALAFLQKMPTPTHSGHICLGDFYSPFKSCSNTPSPEAFLTPRQSRPHLP